MEHNDRVVERDAIARRIRALMAKTVENGATEAEALAAAEKARKLMDAHRLTQTDIEVQAEHIEDMYMDRPRAKRLAAVDHCLGGIAEYCGVKAWFSSRSGTRRIRMLGLKADVDMASYLYQMIAAAIEYETKRSCMWGATAAETRALNQSFQVGMATRISNRLYDMARKLDPVAKTATGSSLVVVKDALVKNAFDRLGIRLTGGLSGMRASNGDAYRAGAAAGDRVNLSRPVGEAVAKLIK